MGHNAKTNGKKYLDRFLFVSTNQKKYKAKKNKKRRRKQCRVRGLLVAICINDHGVFIQNKQNEG